MGSIESDPIDQTPLIMLLERESIKNGVPHNIVEAHVLHGTPMVKAWREHLGLTQEELAEASGMAQASIARIERGDSITRHATLVKLAAAMDLGNNWGRSKVRLNQLLCPFDL